MRIVCMVAGHKWTPAAEAPDPHGAGARFVKTYGGDDLVLVCRRCGHQKVTSVATAGQDIARQEAADLRTRH